MSATIFLLTYASLLAPGLAPQRTTQEGRTRANAIVRPVEVSLQGWGEDTSGGIQPLTFGPITPLLCLEKIADQASSNCLTASSTPTLGSLYPLGPEFNIDGAGNIRIGTGSIYKAGTLFLHNKGGTRNTALGLSASQVLEAFRSELGVDRCVVLPSISFHIDYDVTFRSQPEGILAFINDTGEAVRIIIEEGLRALEEHRHLPREIVLKAQERVASGEYSARFAIGLITVSTLLERIADHCTNICEQVIYLESGLIVRHLPEGWTKPAPPDV